MTNSCATDVPAPDEPEDEPSLMGAIWGGRSKEVAQWLTHGHKVDWTADRGTTLPLHWCTFQGHKLTAGVLLAAAGVAVNGVDVWGLSPLHWAVFGGHADLVELLLEARADVNQVQKVVFADTPLHYACGKYGDLPLVKLLCSYGATRDGREVGIATRQGLAEIAAWLESTADCTTPLHHPTLVPPHRALALLSAGANLRAARAPGERTPFSIARELEAQGSTPDGSTAWLLLHAAEPPPAEESVAIKFRIGSWKAILTCTLRILHAPSDA